MNCFVCLIPIKIGQKIKDKGKAKKNTVEKIQNLIKPITFNLFVSLAKFILCLQIDKKIVLNSFSKIYNLFYV